MRDVDPLGAGGLGLRPDRLERSRVPDVVDNREDVTVAVGPDGAARAVTGHPRLVIHGTGGYVVREVAPARAAVGAADTPPAHARAGTVVQQVFSPGVRALDVRLTLDAGLEAARPPRRVALAFRDSRGRYRRLQLGGRAPAVGTVTVTLVSQTDSARTAATGRADVGPPASAPDRLRDPGRTSRTTSSPEHRRRHRAVPSCCVDTVVPASAGQTAEAALCASFRSFSPHAATATAGGRTTSSARRR